MNIVHCGLLCYLWQISEIYTILLENFFVYTYIVIKFTMHIIHQDKIKGELV